MKAHLPAKIGPYRPLTVIGGGAYGTVYSARGPGGALVAVRTLPSWLSEDHDARRRLFDLLDALRTLKHPGLCAVYGAGQDERLSYAVTEVVAGVDLKLLGVKPPGEPDWPWQVARIVADAAEAVGALHRAGQLHEGIKEQNVVVKWDGSIKVMDLGLERIGQTLPLTRTGKVKGRFRHYAPEKLEGSFPSPGRDVWSLGVIAWDLLRGGRLFDAKNDVDTILAITQHDVPPLPPTVPAPLSAIALRCLAEDPRSRFRDAGELALALRHAIALCPFPTDREALARRLRSRYPKELARWRRILDQTSEAAGDDS